MNRFFSFINRFLITGLFTVICLIVCKKSCSMKQFFYDNFLSDNFDFAYFNSLYKKYFGSLIPFDGIGSVSPVFSEKLIYTDFSSYLDGVSLSVGDNYTVPSLNSGLVIFVGEKDGYGKTVIVQQSDGVDVWYSNLDSVSVKLYEYISDGGFIGNCSGNLFLVFKKDGNVLDYKDFI